MVGASLHNDCRLMKKKTANVALIINKIGTYRWNLQPKMVAKHTNRTIKEIIQFQVGYACLAPYLSTVKKMTADRIK